MVSVGVNSGCNTERLAANTAIDLALRAEPSFAAESELEVARAAAATGLKQLEGFLLVTGKRPDLLALLAKGFCGWGAGFVQDAWEVEVLERGGEGASELASARSAFARCARYAQWSLPAELASILEAPEPAASQALARARPQDAAALYWLVTAHATLLGMTGEVRLALLVPRMITVLRRVVALAPALEHGQAHLLLGVLLVVTPIFGDVEEGARQLALARRQSAGKLLIVDVLVARALAVARQDRAQFRELLAGVVRTSPAIWPEQRMANELAHRMARRYLVVGERWFDARRR